MDRINYHVRKIKISKACSSSLTSSNPKKSGPLQEFLLSLSHREKASVEQYLLDAIKGKINTSSSTEETIFDPILHENIAKLDWIRSIRIGTNTPNIPQKSTSIIPDQMSSNIQIQVHLRLPTLLHPDIKELKQRISLHLLRKLVDIARKEEFHGGWVIRTDPSDSSMLSSSSILYHDLVQFRVTSEAIIPYAIHRNQGKNIHKNHLEESLRNLGPGLQNVLHFVAVYSCKGGVGKSTIATNLAYELARLGGRVGLLDVDIYGPSLPVLVHPDDPTVRRSPLGSGMVFPIDHRGVKMLSLGFVSPMSGVPGSGLGGGAAVMRGPMAGKVVTQLLKGTDWGNLDVLLLDLPPGTGDVQLTICQELQLSGAVSVTTPSKLALNDARKGIEMFTGMGIPTLVVVENMAFFQGQDGTVHHPFGNGIINLAHDIGIKAENIIQLPVSSYINEANDTGTPLCLLRPPAAHKELDIFEKLGRTLATELLALKEQGRSECSDNEEFVSFPDRPNAFSLRSLQLRVDNVVKVFVARIFSEDGAYEATISGSYLRGCSPKTGRPLGSEDANVVDGLFPCKIEKKGYGYSVEWADGGRYIYSNIALATAAGGTVTGEN